LPAFAKLLLPDTTGRASVVAETSTAESSAGRTGAATAFVIQPTFYTWRRRIRRCYRRERARMLVVKSFADIPAEVQRRVDAGERVILILLDAFGLEFLERNRDHPLIQRLDVTPLTSQFPSTTTAHVPSVHFGMPVHEHGLYEWNILEPALGEIICPLRFNASGAEEEGTLVGRLDPSVLAPGRTFYESLAVPCIVAQPFRLAGSFSAVATRGARVIGFRRLREGVRAVGEAFAAREAIIATRFCTGI